MKSYIERSAAIILLFPTHTAGAAATKLGVTRNSIIGVWWRSGLRRSMAPLPGRDRATASPVTAKALPVPRKAKPAPAPVLAVPGIASRPAKAGPVSIMGLTHRHCKFIEGDPRAGGDLYCGSPVKNGGVYCDAHHAICHQPPRASQGQRVSAS